MKGALHFLGVVRPAAHTIFVDEEAEAAALDPAQYFDTAEELLGRSFNRPRTAQLAQASLLAGSTEAKASTKATKCAPVSAERWQSRTRSVGGSVRERADGRAGAQARACGVHRDGAESQPPEEGERPGVAHGHAAPPSGKGPRGAHLLRPSGLSCPRPQPSTPNPSQGKGRKRKLSQAESGSTDAVFKWRKERKK